MRPCTLRAARFVQQMARRFASPVSLESSSPCCDASVTPLQRLWCTMSTMLAEECLRS